MVSTQSRKLEMRIKYVHQLPIKSQQSTNQTIKNRDKSISGPSVDKFFVIHGLSTWYVQSRPKTNKDDLSVHIQAKNIFTLPIKAKNIFGVRTKAKIIFANFVTYWRLRGYNFYMWLKGLLKNSYNKPQYSSQHTQDISDRYPYWRYLCTSPP